MINYHEHTLLLNFSRNELTTIFPLFRLCNIARPSRQLLSSCYA